MKGGWYGAIPHVVVLAVLSAVSRVRSAKGSPQGSVLDNAVLGEPKVTCMEDRLKLTFNTEKPFTGRIFVKGMIDNEKCINSYASNSKQAVDFQLVNGACNMRRSRKLGPEQRGVEQSITIIISFHDVFITKVDRAYRCTCFYMEADRVVTNRFDVSQIPTTELIDTARMPTCTYTVRRGSVNGPIVTYANVGEPVFHVWNCDSDMFSMLVHNCFVDDGAGRDRKPILDEQGCSIDQTIVPELHYNTQANLAYSEVSVFKFADKITTYFQCAVSTCMIAEGMCKGKTPPRCGPNNRRRRTVVGRGLLSLEGNNSALYSDEHTMDLNTGRILVLDSGDMPANWVAGTEGSESHPNSTISSPSSSRASRQFSSVISPFSSFSGRSHLPHGHERLESLPRYTAMGRGDICLSHQVFTLLTIGITATTVMLVVTTLTGYHYLCNRGTLLAKY